LSERICALVSGGVDSAVLTWKLLDEGLEVQPVYVSAGLAWEAVERRWLHRYLGAIAATGLRPLKELTLPVADVYEYHWSLGTGERPGYDTPDEAVYLPGRNLVLLSKAAVYCALNGIGRVALGLLAANPFPDATDDFFAHLERTISLGLATDLRIERPLSSLHKADVVQLGAHLPLELTFSCIRPVGERHCGDCNKCAERQHGFIDAGKPDKTDYAHSPRPMSASLVES
jgi:7-cyano-7-deazaguanine synthase